MELQGTVALVTGGTGGLGRRICRALASRGVAVAVGYGTRREEAETVVGELAQLGGRAIAVGTDVTSPEAIGRAVERVTGELGGLDILVNDAAYNTWIAFPELEALTLEIWQKILEVNLTGPFVCMKAVAPIMRERGRGRIVNITSIAGLHPIGSSIAYAVSKSALIHLTRCMAVSLAPAVLVNSVAPGYMEGTRMSDALSPEYRERAQKGALLRRGADKDDVAEAVVEFCRTDSITGQTLVIDAGRIFH
jgi:3-oxoacyl-[acyl-carrier protein] reductase